MWSSPLLLLALLVLVAVAAVAAFRLARRAGLVPAVVAAVVVALAVSFSAVQLWARAALDESTLARSISWLEADVDDIDRFPSRPIPAGDETAELRPTSDPDDAPDRVTVAGRGEVPLELLIDETQTEALIVLRGDEVVVERYANGGAPDALHTSFSVAKSFLGTLVGIAIDRGEIASLDDPITRYVPELLERDERFGLVTLRHLLTMSSGLAYTETGTPWGDDAETYYAPDLRRTALDARIAEPPGRRWHYNNYNPLLVGLALERATGRSVAEYLSEVLWQPMGAEASGSWSLDSDRSGFEKMESGLNAVPLDYARFGLLFARQGRIDGRQVVPEAWVEQATAMDTATDPAPHYQYWWWVDTERPGRFSARGNHGQFIYVAPERDVVVVRLGRDYGGIEWPDVLRDLADRTEDTATTSPERPAITTSAG